MKKYYEPILDENPYYYAVIGNNGGQYPNSNSFLIDRPEMGAILIDCGPGRNVIRKIRKNFDIQAVYFTHWHEDHIAAHGMLPNAKFFSHERDAPPIAKLDTFFKYYDIIGHDIEDDFKTFMEAFRLEPLPGVHSLKDGHQIPVDDGIQIELVHAPGHTAGHSCFIDFTSKIAFLGDVDLAKFGGWYGARDSNLLDFLVSIEKIRKMDLEHVYTSHQKVLHGRREIQEYIKKYLSKIEARNERILHLLSESSGMELKDFDGKHVIYREYDYLKDYLFVAERIMVRNHLDLLVQQEKIEKMEGEKFILA